MLKKNNRYNPTRADVAADFQDHLIHESRRALNRSYELLRRTEILVGPGLPISSTNASDDDREQRQA